MLARSVAFAHFLFRFKGRCPEMKTPLEDHPGAHDSIGVFILSTNGLTVCLSQQVCLTVYEILRIRCYLP